MWIRAIASTLVMRNVWRNTVMGIVFDSVICLIPLRTYNMFSNEWSTSERLIEKQQETKGTMVPGMKIISSQYVLYGEEMLYSIERLSCQTWRLSGNPHYTSCGKQPKPGRSVVLIWGCLKVYTCGMDRDYRLRLGDWNMHLNVCACVCTRESLSRSLPRR